MDFLIAKVLDEHRQVFGFASIALNVNGHLVEDLQDDMIEPDDLEKAAYDFVLDFRETGEMHRGAAKGKLIDSMVFTPEKMRAIEKALGKPEGSLDIPTRWWVGFQVDPHTFEKVKRGEYKMFSIQGSVQRERV